jgi:apolipoprotein D and lipocalin family protein
MTRLRVQLAAILLVAACTSASGPPPTTVSDFEPKRYLGTWHEIAAIPAWFQRHCASDTRAEYTAVPEPGRIGVLNSCRRAEGTLDSARGRARSIGPQAQGRLEVTFFRPLGFWLWPIAGAYDVLALDEDYRWSLVGHPSRDYAWILAREPRLDDATLNRLRKRLATEGYNPCRLILTADADPRRGSSICSLG